MTAINTEYSTNSCIRTDFRKRPRNRLPPCAAIPHLQIDRTRLLQIFACFRSLAPTPVYQPHIAQALRLAPPMSEQSEYVQRIAKRLECLVEFTPFKIGIADIVELGCFALPAAGLGEDV